MTILEKTAYIKGLCEGLELDKKDSAEAKVIKALLDLCQDMAEEIDALGSDVEDLIDYCEELDEDLGDVEALLYDDEECEDEDEDDDFYEVTCPACGETVCFDEDCDPASLVCPACGEAFDCTCDGESCEGCTGCDK